MAQKTVSPSTATPIGQSSPFAKACGNPPSNARCMIEPSGLASDRVQYKLFPSTASPHGAFVLSVTTSNGWQTPSEQAPPKQSCPHAPQFFVSTVMSPQGIPPPIPVDAEDPAGPDPEPVEPPTDELAPGRSSVPSSKPQMPAQPKTNPPRQPIARPAK